MKYLFINSVCGIRSTGRICTDIADALISQKHECRIAYGRETFVPDKYKEISYQICSKKDVIIHALLSRITDKSGFYSKKATRKFIKWIREYNPDIIHLHNLHGYYIDIEQLFRYLKKSRKRIIWTLHDCWPFTGHCTYFDVCRCEKWKTGCEKCPIRKEYPKSFLDGSSKNWKRKKKLFNGIPNLTIVTPSEWLKKLVEQSFLKEYMVKVIYNGIDTSHFYPDKEKNRERERRVIGVSADWDYRKGLEDFKKLQSGKYKITLVGLSEKQKKNLPSDIIGISRTNSVEELRQLYASADCYLNPSYEDNFPTTNIEALACGIPVITYNTGGSPEAVGDCGMVVPKGDTEAMKKAAETIRIDSDVCIAQSKKFTKDNMIKQYLDLYTMGDKK